MNFVNLPLQSNDHSSSYRLLKFIDGRDERYTHLIDYENPDDTNGESDTYHLVSEKKNLVENAPVDDYYDYHHHNENEEESTRFDNWCTPNKDTDGKVGHVVLFIPGHEGKYNQARSLAAHGIQLSRHPSNLPRGYLKGIKDKLINGTMDATTNDIRNFVYDVYTLDFNGEGSAWHVSKLHAQADFVVQSIERLSQECGETMNGITIVAHSFGGIVARKAILSLYENEKKVAVEKGTSFEYGSLVKNVITLASPHQFIPFVLDQNVINFHKGLEMEEKSLMESGHYQTTIISFSGGLRDELIPHQSSYWTGLQQDGVNYNIVTSVLASDVMQTRVEKSYNDAKFGMDHKCIVWCHGLLSTIRELIHVFVQSSNEPKLERDMKTSQFLRQKLSAGGLDCKRFSNELSERSCDNDSDCEYQCRIRQKELLLRKEFGLFGSVALQITMSYNIRPFVIVYLVNGILYQILISIIVGRPIFKNLIRRFHFKLPYFHGKSIDMSGTSGTFSPAKELTILHLYGYIICPSIASFLLLYNFSSLWTASPIITVLLSFAAMSLYSILLYGLIPLAAFVTSKIPNFFQPSFSNHTEVEELMSWRAYKQKQKQLLVASIMIQAIYCIAWSQFTGIDNWAFNILATQAHCSMVFIMFVLLNILNLGFSKLHFRSGQRKDDTSRVGIMDKQSRILLQCRMVSAILTPIFPFFVLSKLIFFTSLLTRRGQIASIPYAQAENVDWKEICGYVIQIEKEQGVINPFSGRYCGIASLFQDDQAMIYKCLVLYVVVLTIDGLQLNSRRELFEKSDYSEEKEQLINRDMKKSS